MRLSALLLGLSLLASSSSTAKGALVINEISEKGSSDVCDGHDWIEIHNNGPDAVELGQRYVLHDDKGITDPSAFTFPPGLIAANQYLLLCTKMKLSIPTGSSDSLFSGIALDDPSSPNFGISGKDTITLVKLVTDDPVAVANRQGAAERNVQYEIVSSVVLPDTGDGEFDVTYALDVTTGEYSYTSTPTPGKPNILTPPKTKEEKLAEHLEKLWARDQLGKEFFGMDEKGHKVENAMDDVLQLHVTMDEVDYNYMMANRSFELYRPFQTTRITTVDGTEITRLDSPGRIRPKGQSTLYMAICMDSLTTPFQLDFSAFNETQTLFGSEKIYLRHHMGDMSFSRDYAYSRMLARFGLPHLRTRKVEFYINGEKFGYYSLMEAVDQEYVFARNFPRYDPGDYALYKVKSTAINCGAFTEEELEHAKTRLDEDSSPPYNFQRGEHRPIIQELGFMAADKCLHGFLDNWYKDYEDVTLAYLRYDQDCADMIMGEKMIDRDLGSKKWDKAMKDFITNDFQFSAKCTPACANSDFASHADTEQLLKMFAFYAVTMMADSPIGNGNNYYLAQSGEEHNGGTGAGWKIFPYDFNAARTVFCHDKVCNTRMVHWSIVRPTCESLEDNHLVGPLLTNPTLHAKYIEYVKEFTETVYANETFIQELMDHQAAQDKYVRSDTWAFFGAFYDKELSPDAANWEDEGDRFPLLPTMKARAEDVRAQLAALDTGMYPRGPHVGVNGDYEQWEYCPDWRSEKPNTSTCEQGCKYEGCDMPGWTVESYCDEEFGTCYHGNADEQCRGIYDGERYAGMEDTADGRKTFCRFAAGIPVKAAECPAVGAVKMPQALESSSSSFSTRFLVTIVLSMALLLLQ